MRHSVDTLLSDKRLKNKLYKKKISILGHPASINKNLDHTLDLLFADRKLNITSAFGPQHGMRGDKQDNMIESSDFVDPKTGVRVFSLYGEHRRMTPAMLDTFDVVLVDLQDIGCRIYTYLTTLFYVMQDCAQLGKSVWVLDRPNPAGRVMEGTFLEKGWESFVGFGPTIMRHGLTLGEMALWIKSKYKMNLDLVVVPLKNYKPEKAPGFGFPLYSSAWVNPSPNIPTLSSTRCFAGTVLTEGTLLSEGRGTTRPLEIFGAPDFPSDQVVKIIHDEYSKWASGCILRPCYFEPTFHKFKGQLCSGIQIHTDYEGYDPKKFKPYRLMLAIFKILKKLNPEMMSWRQPPYEYENLRLPIDLLTGSDFARKWVDDPMAKAGDLEARLKKDEIQWAKEARKFFLY
jgi:uncharacterized protein YbbC (DUF1343 family)